jgi:hypothetical protein
VPWAQKNQLLFFLFFEAKKYFFSLGVQGLDLPWVSFLTSNGEAERIPASEGVHAQKELRCCRRRPIV